MGTGEEEEGVDGVIVPQSVETAPETLSLGTGKGLKQGESSVTDNPAYEEMWGAVSGPLEAKRGGGTIARGVKNVHTGFAEEHILPDVVFETQYHSFQSSRKAEDPTGATIKGDKKLSTLGGKTRGNEGYGALDKNDGEQGIKRLSKLKKRKERRTEDEEGSKRRREFPVEDRRMNLPVPLERDGDQQEVKPTSTYHGNAKDLGGRSSYIKPPKHAKTIDEMEVYTSYIPKKCIHVWSGHKKGVSAVRFFPKYGHLLLSAGMDSQVKIWDVGSHGKCYRTYSGHGKSVRDVAFSGDGKHFLSASYDRTVKLWDTETGQYISTFSNRAIPYCIKYNPDEDKQNEFVAGCSDKKIVQYDTRSGEIVQEYNQHLGAVNTITFIDQNRRFVSSSDDKTLRVWEWGIPVVIKYISDPTMHSMPAVAPHPNGKWVCCQSLDNQVITYATQNRFKLNSKKNFRGHLVAGYACQLAFAPDGRFLGSGDSTGRLFFWDWKTTRIFRSLKAHDGVAIGIEWHPTEPSKVASCGWDGLIKYWD
ncbi:hypothetical protein NDN08_002936 [Rhodosorus marinus]|uniref:Pre-mRNA-processing factor 17 n=1 Tax=Rhodosorus marinus TaxID=101924 RepID=A0AAV8UZ64_9RHOD|nr:hypothetical protein NDN08_002936 [Rhodosorus marinus]